jgi:hypothetical protein
MDDELLETEEPQTTMVEMAEVDATSQVAEEIVNDMAATEERRREASEPPAADISYLKVQPASQEATDIEVPLPGSRVCVSGEWVACPATAAQHPIPPAISSSSILSFLQNLPNSPLSEKGSDFESEEKR